VDSRVLLLREGKEKGKKRKRKAKGREGGEKGEGRGGRSPPEQKFWLRPWYIERLACKAKQWPNKKEAPQARAYWTAARHFLPVMYCKI